MTSKQNRAYTYENRPPNSNNVIDLERFFLRSLSQWYWFLITLILSFASAYLYNHFVQPIYLVSTTMLIEEDNRTPAISTDIIMDGFGLQPGMKNLDNQIFILSSWSLVERTLTELPFDIEYFYRGKINKANLYKRAPIIVVLDSLSPIPYDLEFRVDILDENSFRLSVQDNYVFSLNIEATFGELIMGDILGFKIEKSPEYWTRRRPDHEIYFKFHSLDELVNDHLERLTIEKVNSDGAIVELKIKGQIGDMIRDFLSKLTEVFLRNNLEKKNKEAIRTVAFIDKQLEGVSDSLLFTENQLQKFRSRNRVMNISEQGTRIIEQGVNLENERAALMIERNYFDYLNNYISNEDVSNDIITPTTIGISDPNIVNLVGQLSQMQIEYYRYSLGSSDNSPTQSNLLLQIRNTKRTLLEALRSISLQNEMALEDINTRIRELNQQAVSLPVTERELLGIERQFNLNDALYTFLMQKKAEAQIKMASNISDNEIIDPARVDNEPVWPKVWPTYMIAFLIGLGLPFMVILIVDSLNNKIKSEEDLRKITSLSIIGHLIHSKLKTQTVMLEDPSADISEAFRSLRVHIQFLTRKIKSPLILFTSSIPNEGKTFAAINLALAYSLAGKNVLLIGFDLRKPKIFEHLGLSNSKGVSTYLIGKHSMDDIIQSAGYRHLSVITAGPLPPNPAELASSKKAEDLFLTLKESYDYIIVDSAPIGTVSDAFAVAALSDFTILMVRHDQTYKKVLSATLSNTNIIENKDLNILLNDLPAPTGYHGYAYRYSNYSKYGYSN